MIYDGWFDIKDWFKERSLIYRKFSDRIPKSSDKIGVDLEKLQYGWLDMAFYLNGKRKLFFPLTDAYDSIGKIVRWLESLIDLGVSNNYMEQTLHLDCEQGCHALLHYEQVDDPDFGGIEDKRGLFIAYCSPLENGEETLSALCSLQDVIYNIYEPFLNFFAGLPDAKYEEQYIIDNWDSIDGEVDNIIELYNSVKSPKLEWFIATKDYEDWFEKDFIKHDIKTTILMRPRVDGLFWNKEKCVGTTEHIAVNGHIYELQAVKGLKSWYERAMAATTSSSHLSEGYNLAMEVRKQIPENIDIFCDFQKRPEPSNGLSMIRPIIPDTRQWIKGAHSGMRYMKI